MRLLPIVEGSGDMSAVPALVRHTLESHSIFDVQLLQPQRRGEWPRVKQEFDRYFEVAALESAPILWVLDFDCDQCISVEAELAWARDRASRLRNDIPLEVCFMVKEFESLFLADEGTTRTVFPDISPDRMFPADPEAIRDAKGWISSARSPGASYKATMHQARLASQLRLDVLRNRSPSFVRFEASLLRLIRDGGDW